MTTTPNSLGLQEQLQLIDWAQFLPGIETELEKSKDFSVIIGLNKKYLTVKEPMDGRAQILFPLLTIQQGF